MIAGNRFFLLRPKNKNRCKLHTYSDLLVCSVILGGERGIRTPGALQLNGFQDRRNRPLCHLSGCKSTLLIPVLQKIIRTKQISAERKNSGTKDI